MHVDSKMYLCASLVFFISSANRLLKANTHTLHVWWLSQLDYVLHLDKCLCMHLCIHSFRLFLLCPLLLRGATDTARILCQSFTPKRHRQLRVKDLPKVPTWNQNLR